MGTAPPGPVEINYKPGLQDLGLFCDCLSCRTCLAIKISILKPVSPKEFAGEKTAYTTPPAPAHAQGSSAW